MPAMRFAGGRVSLNASSTCAGRAAFASLAHAHAQAGGPRFARTRTALQGHRNASSSAVAASVRRVAVLHDERRGAWSSRRFANAPLAGREPGTTTASFGHLAAHFALVHEVVDHRGRGEDDAGREHRAAADDHAFEDAAQAADEALVLDDHRTRAGGLEHAADLGSGGEVHARADLRAGSDERVAVDHRALADPGADVDVGGRHDHDAAREVRSAPHGRCRRAPCARRRSRANARGGYAGLVEESGRCRLRAGPRTCGGSRGGSPPSPRRACASRRRRRCSAARMTPASSAASSASCARRHSDSGACAAPGSRVEGADLLRRHAGAPFEHARRVLRARHGVARPSPARPS